MQREKKRHKYEAYSRGELREVPSSYNKVDLKLFKRKILRKIYRPTCACNIKNMVGSYQYKRYLYEIQDSFIQTFRYNFISRIPTKNFVTECL